MTASRVIVSGASSGVGEATARLLASGGARVVAIARRRERLEALVQRVRAEGGEATALAADLSDPGQTRVAIASAVSTLGGIDVLVNCLGTNVAARSLDVLSTEDWDTMVATNLSAPFYCIHGVLPLMREQGSGLIVSISSVAALRPSALSGSAYAASKAGLNMLSGCINLEEGRHGIRSCVICPGDIDTELLDRRPSPPSDEARTTMLRPADIARLVLQVIEEPRHSLVEEIVVRPTAG